MRLNVSWPVILFVMNARKLSAGRFILQSFRSLHFISKRKKNRTDFDSKKNRENSLVIRLL